MRSLCFSSLYWFSGVKCLLTSLLTGITRIISEVPFRPEDFFDIVRRYRVTVVSGPPSHLALCLASSKLPQSDLSSIREYVLVGGAAPYSLIEKFREFAPNANFHIVYGMSEICDVATAGEVEPSNSVGKLRPNKEIKIIDIKDGTPLGPYEIGEVCIRTSIPWAGYYNNPEDTEAIYDDTFWMHSGDVGYMNKDMKLFVVDRKKDILKYNNFQYSPSHIEKVISELKGVAEVCVVGIPDNCMGHLPAAGIIRRFNSDLTQTDVYNHVAENMEHFEKLRGGIYFFDNFPRTASGKTIRHEMTKICAKLRMRSNGEIAQIEGVPLTSV